MKRIIVLLLCLSPSLSTDAQVSRYMATKGERIDFDTAMVIKLEAYRREFKVQQDQRKLIDSLQNALAEKNEETILVQGPAPALSTQNTAPIKTEQLSEKRPGLKWYLNPILYLGAGLLMGVYLVD